MVCIMKLLELTSSRMLRRQRTANDNRPGMMMMDVNANDNGYYCCCCSCWGHGCCSGGAGFAAFVGKENRATNGHLRNYFSAAAAIRHGNKWDYE